MSEYKPKYTGNYIGKGKYVTNEEVCKILSDVVSMDSTFGFEGNCGRLIEKIAKEHGLGVEIMPVDGDRFNVMITVGAESYKSRKLGLMLHGHYDTVPVLDMEDPFVTKIRDNMMWGRGIVDQKCGLVASLCAAIAIKRSGKTLSKPLCVAAIVDEESEHRGSYTLVRSGVDADYAIVTEPTNTETCEFGCKGTSPVRIVVKGKTAHASNPWVGVNAIQKSMPILSGLFAMEFPELDLGELGKLRGTLCVSKMDAGTAYNNVPGEAVIWMDRRTVPGENTALALAQVKEVIEKAKQQDPELVATAEVARPDWHWPPIRERGLNPTLMDLDCELYHILQRAAVKSGMAPLQKRYSNGYNEMDFLINDLGIPTLVYGPGDGRMAHSPREEVDIDQVCNVAEVYCNMIEEICF
jgi:acetylornithine deacetylase/succinyl-diaminopimelate desuccinylase